MRSKCIYIALLLVATGCDFDRDRQYDLQFPARLILTNTGRTAFEVEAIYNSLDTGEGFVLKGFTLKPNGEVSLDISEATYSAIDKGAVELTGKCNDGRKWKTSGKTLNFSNPAELSLRLDFNPCESPLN